MSLRAVLVLTRVSRGEEACLVSSLGQRELVEIVGQIHTENYGVYGVCRMWHVLTREGILPSITAERGKVLQ